MKLSTHRSIALLALIIGAVWAQRPLAAAELIANQALGLRHPPGFLITQFARRELAPDIQSLTIDTMGRVVVSGRGWIRRLEDADADGKAESATTFAETATGARGMVFIGNDLYCATDGSFGRYLDSDGDGKADGPAQRFFDFAFGPEGVQTIRRGPDGSWYVLTGRHGGLGPAHWNHVGSPIRNPMGGSLLHISPDLSRSEVVAQGFLHASDFDIHSSGMIFTYDQGVPNEAFLPWLGMPRLFQVAHGAHHGWRWDGNDHPWAAAEYDPAQVPILWSANAGAPEAMTFYQHHQFPTDYRGNLFVADWETGRITVFKLLSSPSGFTVSSAPFIEPIGRNGFTPTAMAVGKDGSLYIGTGGQGTGNGVYRVQFTQVDPKTGKLPEQPPPYLSNFDAALRAPQRLEAWSRAHWMPLALREGRRSFEQVCMSIADPEDYKLVAIEVLTEMFGGLGYKEANFTAKSAFPTVRAKTAWAIGRYQFSGYITVLQELLRDEAPMVIRAALDVYNDYAPSLPSPELLRVVSAFLAHDDARVREATQALATRLPTDEWRQLTKQAAKQTALHRLGVASALLRRQPVGDQPNEIAIDEALAVLRHPEKGTPLLGLTALRLLAQAFGDANHQRPTAAAFAGYELRIDPARLPARAAEILEVIRPLFPTGGALVDAELARALAMFGDHDPNTTQRMLGAFSVQSPVASDIHYLACLGRLNPGGPTPWLTNLASVFLWLDNKTGEPGRRPGLTWRTHAAAIATLLIERHPAVGAALLAHKDFASGEHAWLAEALDSTQRQHARRQFIEASAAVARFKWRPEAIALLAGEPSEQLNARFRELWPRIELQDAIIQALARKPEPVDHDRFVGALNVSDPRTVSAALTALTQLEEPAPAQHIGSVFRVLYRTVGQPAAVETRWAVMAWLTKHARWSSKIEEISHDRRSLEAAYRPVFSWFVREHPPVAAAVAGMNDEEFRYWETQLRDAPWALGKADRGALIFKENRCADCHGGGSGYGPPLAGAHADASPNQIIRSVIYPHLETAPGQSPTAFLLRDGSRLTGNVVGETLETTLVRQENGETTRLSPAEIAYQRLTVDSTMPLGRLKGVNARGLADLHAYLQTLR